MSTASPKQDQASVGIQAFWLGLVVAKSRKAAAVAEPDRDGELRYYGKVGPSQVSRRQQLEKLAAQRGRLKVCYEAGQIGCGFHHLAEEMRHQYRVDAPSLIPKKASDQSMRSGVQS